jgi:predicted transposase/invertase (TIGR01784 family)
MHLVDSVLNPPPGRHLRDIELLNPMNPKETLDDKLSILDIKARDETGRYFNIEMQMLPFEDYPKRILYYACKLHQQQMHEGQDYGDSQPTISINFLNHRWFGAVPDYHLCFRLVEPVHDLLLTDALEFHILELPKFTKWQPCLRPCWTSGFTFCAMRR